MGSQPCPSVPPASITFGRKSQHAKLADDETFSLFVLTDGVALRKEAEGKPLFCHLPARLTPVLSPAVPL